MNNIVIILSVKYIAVLYIYMQYSINIYMYIKYSYKQTHTLKFLKAIELFFHRKRDIDIWNNNNNESNSTACV